MNIDSFFVPHFNEYYPLVYACLFTMLYSFVSEQFLGTDKRETIVDKESLWRGMVGTLQIVYISVPMILFLEGIWNNWNPWIVITFFILLIVFVFKTVFDCLKRIANS